MIDRSKADADLEELMLELGRSRYRNTSAKSMTEGRATDTRPGRALLRESVLKLEAGLVEWRRRAVKRAGAGHSSVPLLKGLTSGVVALLTARVVLDSVALQMPLTSTANAVGSALEEEHKYQAIRKAARGILKDAKGKSGSNSVWPDLKKRLRRNARGGKWRKKRIANEMAGKVGAQHEGWAKRDRLRLGVTLVELLRLHTGLIEIRTVPRDGRRPHAVVVAAESTLNWIEQADFKNETIAPLYLPMRVRPADWVDAWTGGYRLNAMVRRPVVKTRDRATVEAVEKANPELVYRAISTVQRTAWRVNAKVLEVAKALWDAGVPVAGFQERIDEPPPPRPPEGATQEELDRNTRARADWRKRFHRNRGRRVQVAKILHLAQQYKDAPELYFPHQADFRGRLYPQPFFLQPQGDDLARGLLQFAKGKAIRDREAAEWFLGAGAGLFGVNRVAQHQRIAWARGEHQRIVAVAADPLGFRWWLEAESPFQFLGWALDYAAWSAAPAQHVSRFPVGMDGSCNGLQLYSLLTRDEEGARATNVVPSDAPNDVYQVVADRSTQRLMADPDPTAAQWVEFLGGRVPRGYVKRPTMTLPYGSTFHSCVNYVRDEYELQRAARGSTPFEVLMGGGYRACTHLARHVWGAIQDTVGTAHGAMVWLRTVSDLVSTAGRPLEWTAPSGWPVRQAYTKYESRRIQTAVGDTVRFIRYREDKHELSAAQQANGIAPNFIHSLDSSILAFAICRARERGVDNFAVIHDSYGVLAADAPVMGRTLREVVAELFSNDLLAEFRDQVQRQVPDVALPPLPEYGTLDPQVARGARYLYA